MRLQVLDIGFECNYFCIKLTESFKKKRKAFYKEPNSNSATSHYSVLHYAGSELRFADTSYCQSSVSLSEIGLTLPTGRRVHKCLGGLLLNGQPIGVRVKMFPVLRVKTSYSVHVG